MEILQEVIPVDFIRELIFQQVEQVKLILYYIVVVNGTITYVYKTSTGKTPSLGNQVQILDDETGLYYRYCHMYPNSVTLNVGDRVNIGDRIGVMGTTGNSTGTHLHLECTTTKAWQCSSFVNPGIYIGIPNIRGTVVDYDGSIEPIPPEPVPPDKKFSNSTKWLKANSFKLRINK